MEAIGPHLSAGAVVTDTASTKQQVLQWANELLPDTVSFVGGHPIINKTGGGPESAKADVFNGATYCLIPGAGAQPEAVQLMVGLANTVDAEPFFPDAVEHDSLHAAVGFLPLLMATALMRSAAESPANREMRRMTGSEFRQSTALAATDPAAAAVICAANRDAIMRWLDVYTAELAAIRAEIEAGRDLTPLFEKSADARDRWLSKVDEERAAAYREASTSATDQMKRFFLGELGTKLGMKPGR
jgi:prephenate dehydrogenase